MRQSVDRDTGAKRTRVPA